MVENICVLELFGRIIDSRYYQKMRIHLLAESTLFLLDKADVSHIDTSTAVWRYSAAFLSRSLEMPNYNNKYIFFRCLLFNKWRLYGNIIMFVERYLSCLYAGPPFHL